MSVEPAVTVLLAVYNGERHLAESIDSVFAQTFEDFELLVVDDASTDATSQILAGYSDSRLRVLRNERNLGLTRSLNRGLAESRGRYVARQDADDVSAPERLERQAAFLDANPDVTLLASAYVRIREDGSVSGSRSVPAEALGVRWRLLFLNAFTNSSVMFRKDEVERLGGFREKFSYAQDYDLWSRLAFTGTVAALTDTLARYRDTRDSLTAKLAAQVDDVDQISRDNMRRLGPAGARVAQRIDREAAWRLLFAGTRGLTLSRAATAARDILELETAFARYERLPKPTRLRRRGALLLQLTRALARLAAREARVRG
jgi:glycosyltransferase involved in cell wall biosynthesis